MLFPCFLENFIKLRLNKTKNKYTFKKKNCYNLKFRLPTHYFNCLKIYNNFKDSKSFYYLCYNSIYINTSFLILPRLDILNRPLCLQLPFPDCMHCSLSPSLILCELLWLSSSFGISFTEYLQLSFGFCQITEIEI